MQFKRLLAAECPRLARHLAAEGVEPELYATHWFNTAFAYTLPFQHLLRLWDIMMLEGNKVVSAGPMPESIRGPATVSYRSQPCTCGVPVRALLMPYLLPHAALSPAQL